MLFAAKNAATHLFAAAAGSPTAAVGDPAQFLHDDVDEFAGTLAFVAVGCGPGRADQLPSEGIAPGQRGHVVSGEEPGHGPGRHSGSCGDTQRPGLEVAA